MEASPRYAFGRSLLLSGAATLALTVAPAVAVAVEPVGGHGAIQLPAWVESSTGPQSVASAFETPLSPAPKPREPRPLKPAAGLSALPKPDAYDLGELLTSEDAEPLTEEAALLRREVRRLQHAAGEARTPHALTRLLHRYQSCRQQFVDHDDEALRSKLDRIASWALDSRGRLRAAEGKTNAALKDFRLATRLDPTNHAARHDLAVSLAESGDDRAALEELSRILADRPTDASALSNRATIRMRRGENELAIADCDTALAALGEEAAECAGLLALRGVALHAAGRLRAAAIDLNEALRLDPSRAPTYLARGHVFAEGELYDQAISDYAAALEADPRSVEAYRCLAWALATCPEPELRSPSTAVEAAWRARRLSRQEDPLVLDASAAAHAASGEYPEAIRLQQQVLLTSGESAPEGAAERLRLYKAGRPYVAKRGAQTR